MSEVQLLSHQDEFLFHTFEKFALLCGGIGSGKTFTGAHYTINKSFTDGKGMGLITANTYKQLKNSTLAGLFRELEINKIPYEYKNQTLIIAGGTPILTYSLENYDALRGIEISWFWADEVRDTKLEAFLVLQGRLRDTRAKLEGRLTTSPDGFTWLYDYFMGDKKSPEYKIVYADSRENPHLPEGYVETLLDSYDPEMQEQEIGGQFVNVRSGKTYYAFQRERHVNAFDLFPNIPLEFGCDFNVNPICAAAFQYVNSCFYIFDEIYIKNSNTFKLAEEAKRKWGDRIRCYPDSTGSARKSCATRSDHQILRDNDFIIVPTFNPHVKDRVNCLNGHFYNDRIKVHPRCKWLIKDLEQCAEENKDAMLGHITDAVGYPVWKLAPIKRVRALPRIQ